MCIAGRDASVYCRWSGVVGVAWCIIARDTGGAFYIIARFRDASGAVYIVSSDASLTPIYLALARETSQKR